MTAPKDFINDIERAIIDQLRTIFTDAHVFGEYPQAADIQYPAIISEITSSGRFDKFMGESVSFGSEDKTGEIVGIMFTYHIIIDKDSELTVTQDDSSTVVVLGSSGTHVFVFTSILSNCSAVSVSKTSLRFVVAAS